MKRTLWLWILLTMAGATAQENPSPAPETTPAPTVNLAPAVAPSPAAPSTKLVKPSSSSANYQDNYVKRDARGLVHLDFVNVEISDIVKSISEITKRNFIYDEKTRGKITLVSPKPVSVQEAYRAFVSALEVKELTVVRVGNLYKIVPIRDMKTQPLPTDAASGGYDEFVTRIIPIQHSNADEIARSLRGLVSKNGDLISYPQTNTLILTDSIANIRRLMDIIRKLDQKGFQESISIVKLRYAPASDTADKITRIFELGNPKSQAPNPNGQGAEATSKFISKVLPDERTNSLIVVANTEGLRRVQELVDQIDQSMVDMSGKGYVHVHYLQYADASELAATLGGVASNKPSSSKGSSNSANGSIFPQNAQTPAPPNVRNPSAGSAGAAVLGEDVKITADPYTNSLIVTASPTDYEALIPVIQKLDIRRPQAFVEAMIMEVDINKAADLGASANLAGTVGGAKAFGATTFGSTSSVFLPTSGDALQGFVAGFQGRTIDIPLAGGESLTIPVFGGLFRALQTNGTVNVLSTPNILTQDNTEAEIVVGQVVPFITAQGRDVNNQPINQIQRENVAITLRITPQINSSDELTLKIFQESQDLVAGADVATFGPTTSKRSAQTTVLVKDGQTITVGGLINDRILTSESKVPILGDIPLLGWFFKSKTKTKRKTSLVIFITPHIIRYPEDMERISIEKNEQRMRFNRENGMGEHPGIRQYKIDRDLKVPNKVPAQVEPAPAALPEAPEEEAPVESLPQDPVPAAKTAPVIEESPPIATPIPTPEPAAAAPLSPQPSKPDEGPQPTPGLAPSPEPTRSEEAIPAADPKVGPLEKNRE